MFFFFFFFFGLQYFFCRSLCGFNGFLFFHCFCLFSPAFKSGPLSPQVERQNECLELLAAGHNVSRTNIGWVKLKSTDREQGIRKPSRDQFAFCLFAEG